MAGMNLSRAGKGALCVALAATLSMPAAAFAAQPDETAASAAVAATSNEAAAGARDAADYVDFEAEREAASDRAANAGDGVALLADYNLVSLSDEFKYHLQFESGQNYDQGFSWGDGYHAMGYYQFDNRYVLQDFLTYCYGYDAETFSMFEFATDPDLDISSMAMYDWDEEELTEIGQKLEDAWHAAYAADSDTFAALQDTYAYESYYLPVESDLAAQGIDISGRRDCIKAMCWGLSSLFGPSGCHRFTGGYVYEWDDATEQYTYVYYQGAGLSDDMSDAEFAVALGSYVVDMVPVFYASQPEYHEGWCNRYRNEIATCLSYIPDLVAGSWYDAYVDYVESHGIMSGYSGGYMAGRFGPEDRITRAQAATILYRCANPGSVDTTDPSHYATSTLFSDMPSGPVYYAAAVDWCYEAGIITGYRDGSGASTGLFGPDDYVTREQLAAMIERYAEWAGVDTSADTGFVSSAPDGSSVSGFAVESVAWCMREGIMTGVQTGGASWLEPQNAAKRAQMAKMVTVLLRDVIG